MLTPHTKGRQKKIVSQPFPKENIERRGRKEEESSTLNYTWKKS